MFDYNNMIQRAIQFFPTWSDIRKRYKNEQAAIDKYKKCKKQLIE